MKTAKLLSILLVGLFLNSCTSTYYYQVYKVAPVQKTVQEGNLIVFEDENCKIYYNLFSNGGDAGFRFFNKTDKNIYLNLDESFFVLNGISYNYYKNRTFTESKNSGMASATTASFSRQVTGFNWLDLLQTNAASVSKSSNVINSSGYSVATQEEKQLIIPSKTSKIILEYNITDDLYRDCDLLIYPTKKQVKTKSFTQKDTPYEFSNRLVYTVGQGGTMVKTENQFYISAITNYPESEFLTFKLDEFCGEKSMVKKNYIKVTSPDMFYIKYPANTIPFKH